MNPHRNRSSSNRRRRYTFGALVTLGCLAFVAACEEVPSEVAIEDSTPLFKKPGGKPGGGGGDVSVTVEMNAVASPGLSSNGWIFSSTASTTSNTQVKPSCSDDRFILDPAFDPPAADCNDRNHRAQLMIPGLLSVNADGPFARPDSPVQPGSSMSPYFNYFFLVDSNGDGKFRLPKDDSYDYVWTDASVDVTDSDGNGDIDIWRITGYTVDLIPRSGTATRGLDLQVDVTVRRQ